MFIDLSPTGCNRGSSPTVGGRIVQLNNALPNGRATAPIRERLSLNVGLVPRIDGSLLRLCVCRLGKIRHALFPGEGLS